MNTILELNVEPYYFINKREASPGSSVKDKMSETLRWNRVKFHDLCNEITEIVNMTSPLPKAIFRWASILVEFCTLRNARNSYS